MTITPQTLSTLSPSVVSDRLTALQSMIASYAPSADLRRGVLHDLVLQLNAVVDAAEDTLIDQVRQSNSLSAIQANPTLATDAQVDTLVSNYRVTRLLAATATGTITIVLSANVPVTVPTTLVFTANGLNFSTTTTYNARVFSAQVNTSTDILIQSRGDGTFYFSVPVTCATAAAAGNVANGTAFTLSATLAKFVKAYAASSFTGGQDRETNAQLVARLLAGAALQSWGARASVENLVRASVPATVSVSSVGAGDAEQLRDRHGLWPTSSGGRVDVYVKTQPLYNTVSFPKTAVLSSRSGTVGTWQITFAKTELPAFYEVSKVLLLTQDPTSAGFSVTSDSRNYDLSTGYTPDITQVEEAVYSSLQTVSILYVDTATDASVLTIGTSTNNVLAVVRQLPNIDVLQAYLADPTRRPVAGDVLVKACVPCFVTVAFTLHVPSGAAQPVLATVQNAVAQAVNATGIAGRLLTSVLTQAALAAAPTAVGADSFALTGRIRRWDGTNVSLTGTQSLVITPDASNLITNNTVGFFLQPSDVAITVTAN